MSRVKGTPHKRKEEPQPPVMQDDDNLPVCAHTFSQADLHSLKRTRHFCGSTACSAAPGYRRCTVWIKNMAYQEIA